MCKSSPAFCADIQRVVLLCSHSESSQSQEAVVGRSGKLREKIAPALTGEWWCCSAGAQPCAHNASHSQLLDTSSSLWLFCVLHFLSCELNYLAVVFFLFLSHSFEVATLNSLFQRRHSCSALSHIHAHTHKLTYLAGLPLHQKLQRGGRGWGLWTLCVCVHACRQKERESDRLCSHLRLTDNSRKCCFWMHKVHKNEIRKLRQAWNFNDFYF